MTRPIRIRVRLSDSVAEVRVQFQHPMENGLRRDERSGKPIPAHFIRRFVVALNERPLVSAQCGRSVARNPAFVFRLDAVQAGDRLTVRWRDNLGEHGREEYTIA